MIAIDTNILVYAHRHDSRWHERARRCVTQLAEGTRPWMIPWPCVHEFLAITTHPRIYDPPTPLELAMEQMSLLSQSPSLSRGAESVLYWDTLRSTIAKARAVGPMIHDARIAAICIEHGVELLLTADHDFSRFTGLKIRNPLVD
ncbi:MAG: TA system VapC family ribonuclease toxin [Tepidisphaeraceae bacterium]